MKKLVVNASTNEGGKLVSAGSRVIDQAENMDELTTLHTEAEIIKGFYKSHVIEVQAQIRTGSETPTNVKIFKGLSKAQQDIALAKAMGVIDLEQSNRNYHEASLMEGK